MSAEVLVIQEELFLPIQVGEDVLRGLVATEATSLFGGLRYYDFRPPIPSPHGARHPDGVLVAPGCADWWVVELEIHTHDVDEHIGPQLRGLVDGVYGHEAFRYLERHATFSWADYEAVNVWQPAFLLIVDHATPQIRRVAESTAFALVETAIFRSVHGRYALSVSGPRPTLARPPLPAGVDVRLDSTLEVALLVPLGGRSLPPETGAPLLIADRETTQRRTADGGAVVLPLKPIEVRSLLGESDRYRLTLDDRLVSLDFPDLVHGPISTGGAS